MADTLKERCSKRLQGLQKARRSYEKDAREIASYAQPSRSRWLANKRDEGRQTNNRLNNSHGIFAFRTLRNGMASGLTPQSRPWFSLTPYDESLKDDDDVRGWAYEVERRMYAFLASTNFYEAVEAGYLEIALFGTEACVMVEDNDEGAVCRQLTFGEYFLGMGPHGQPDTLYRECPKTVRNAVEEFGKENVSKYVREAYDKPGSLDNVVVFYHAIEPNPDYEPGAVGWRGKKWLSLYWDELDSSPERYIQRNGFDEQPFWAPRWDTIGADVYGQGPGHDALPDLRELQVQVKRKAEATDWHIHPEMIASSRVKLKRMPKNVVSIAGSDLDVSKLVHVPYEVPYQTIAAIKDDIEANKSAINEATYADLFMAITNMQGVQPRNVEEIAARNEEKLTQLGPVIERMNNEKLEVAIERTFGIMQRGRMIPPAPEAMRNSPDIKIEFVSILTQMQRMVGLGQIERAIGFAGNIAPMFPSIAHKIDANELLDDYWGRAGAPAKALRSTEDAEADAEAEARNAQAAQMAEAAGKAAPAAGVAVDAARLMSETPAAAPPAVQDLVPLIPR